MGQKGFLLRRIVVRAILGETSEELERIIELSCNIDDMDS